MNPPRSPGADLAPSLKSLAAITLPYLDDMPSSPIPLPPPAAAHSARSKGADEEHPERQTTGRGWTTYALQRQRHVATPPATPPHDLPDAGCTLSTSISFDSHEPGPTWQAPPTVKVQNPTDDPIVSSASPPLPSLIRYVDNHLLCDKTLHDNPPDKNATCPICHYVHDKAPIKTTFLPLSPCGCWVHYRCFIWHATRDTLIHDHCPTCNTELFQPEGIIATILTARTSLELQDKQYPKLKWYRDSDTTLLIHSHLSEYFAECMHIEAVIHRHFFHALTLVSPFTDKSPDLTQCYYEVLEDLDKWRRVRSKWLSWSTEEGYFLYGMLVAGKMRRYLGERQGRIIGTEGWRGFLEGMNVLQGKILEKIHEGGGHCNEREGE